LGDSPYNGQAIARSGLPSTSNNNNRSEKPETVLPNGAKYTGEWLGDQRDGYGTQIWVDGSKYVGEWVNDKANGKGTLHHADGDVYEG